MKTDNFTAFMNAIKQSSNAQPIGNIGAGRLLLIMNDRPEGMTITFVNTMARMAIGISTEEGPVVILREDGEFTLHYHNKIIGSMTRLGNGAVIPEGHLIKIVGGEGVLSLQERFVQKRTDGTFKFAW